jgi:hypothetical protein
MTLLLLPLPLHLLLRLLRLLWSLHTLDKMLSHSCSWRMLEISSSSCSCRGAAAVILVLHLFLHVLHSNSRYEHCAAAVAAAAAAAAATNVPVLAAAICTMKLLQCQALVPS